MGCQPSKFPPEGVALLAADTDVVMEEHVPTVLLFRHLRTPHKRSNYLYGRTLGCLAISHERAVGYVREHGRWQRQVHVVFDTDNAANKGVEFHVSTDGHLCITSDLAVTLGDQYSGTMELTYHTRQPAEGTYMARIRAGLARAAG